MSIPNRQIADNIARIRERIARALNRSGREDTEVTLLAVTKTVDINSVVEAYKAGIRDFCENYIQEARGKQDGELMKRDSIRWHFIGHLQTNKVKEAIGKFVLIHSVDSLSLAREIGRRAERLGKTADILLEVKMDAVDTKFGFMPAEALDAVMQIREISGIQLNGLMGMAPFSSEPENARPYFRQLNTIFEQIPPESRKILSMGMTGDFEVAIEEGATLVRIGTALFGGRLPRE